MRQYHIQLEKGEIPPYVLLPGNPGRVEKMAKLLDNARFLRQNREYCTWVGSWKNLPVAIVSTGIGGPSAAIAIEELVRIGCHTFIRTGTCGLLQPEQKRGDFIIATASVRGGATANAYVPPEYPAVADFEVVRALSQSANNLSLRFKRGIIQCKDAFYAEEPECLPNRENTDNYWQIMERANVLASEMESDTLFVLGSIRNVRVGTILLGLGGKAQDGPLIGSKPEEIETMTRCALDALYLLEDRSNESEI